jgi:type II secretion system protein E
MEQTPRTIGNYQIQRELGRGGMGVVYLAIDSRTGGEVALKILPPTMADRSTVARFHREGVAQSKLKHPNIIEVYEAESKDGCHYIAMEFARGKTLRAMVKQSGHLGFKKALEISAQACDALDYAHGLGFVHRDIKSDNIMVTGSGQVKLMDFGLVRITGATIVTQSGVVVGTPEYMSPEQISGEEIDERTDIYSFGITMYEMLTGKLPFEGGSPQALTMMHRYEQHQPVRDLVNNLPKEIDEIVARALAKDPGERFQSAGDMAEAIRGGLNEIQSGKEERNDREDSTRIIRQVLDNINAEEVIETPLPENGFQKERIPLSKLALGFGLADKDSFPQLYQRYLNTGKPLWECAIDLGLAGEEQVIEFLDQVYGIKPLQKINELVITKNLRELLPQEFAQKYYIVPTKENGDELQVAMVNPLDVSAMDYLDHLGQWQVNRLAVTRSDFVGLFERVYQAGNVYEGILEELGASEVESEVEVVVDEEPLDLDAEAGTEAPIVKLVNYLIHQAVRDQASDIHIEPDEDKLRVRYRVDGILKEKMCPPKQLQAAIISRIKIMADMDIAERRIPQDGRIKLKVQNRNIDFRISTLPGIHGEKAVIRVLDESKLLLGLDQLGFEPELLGRWERMISRPYGIILVTGPTGGGKTTTLYSTLSRLNTIDTNIITVEDPVEYRLEGITQVQINPKAGVTFATGLKSIFRQDPDIIMVGEMRDLETAQISIKAALTGHLVFSTLHTNDAAGAITRLMDMGIPPYLAASSLIGVMGQRLVRSICPACKEEYFPSDKELETIGLADIDMHFYQGKGCTQCQDTGYRGRVALIEFMEINEEIKRAIIAKSASNQILELARKNGLKTLWEEGIKKVAAGQTTLEEVKRQTTNFAEAG